MTRTAAREIAVTLSFSITGTPEEARSQVAEFLDKQHFSTLAEEDSLFTQQPDARQEAYITQICLGVAEKREELDGYIQRFSKGWKPGRISKTALAVLRCCMYELLYMPEVPPSAAINEAVELAKNYDEPETVSFINGILGSFSREVLGAATSSGDGE